MERTDQINELAQALAAASAEFAAIPADHTADIQGREGRASYSYRYATLQACIAATRPALAKNGLSVIQLVETNPDSGFITLTTLLAHKSGQYIKTWFIVSSGGEKDPKAVGAAIAYVRRWTYSAILGLAADDEAGGGGGRGESRAPKENRGDRQGGRPAPDTSTWRLRYGDYKGKTLEEVWALGEEGQEFVAAQARADNRSAFIRNFAQQVVERHGSDAGSDPAFGPTQPEQLC
jgi:hypothetical protein